MNLFVDSNIFLNFYHFSNDDLEELKKLIPLIKGNGTKLFITRQVINEFKRNRDNKVSDAFRKFQECKFVLQIPQMCKTYSEYEEIKDLNIRINKKKNDLSEKLAKDIEEKTLKADEVIKELFKLGEIIETGKYIEAAKDRYHFGNPPGKDNSYGDALNWESLLELIPKNEDIFFISDDKDYKSPLDSKNFNSFLLDEWKEKKCSRLFYYTQLSEFFRDHHKDIKLKDEDEKNVLIESLRESPNFSTTHSIIGRLSKFDVFSDDQIKQLVDILLSNSQVNWIATDSDVNGFYATLVKDKDAIFEPVIVYQMREHLFPPVEESIPPQNDFFS